MFGSIKKTNFDNIYVFCASCIYIHFDFKAYVFKPDTCYVVYTP